MSRWHRENPEAYERGEGPPDWRDAADRLRKEERENPGLYACVTCGENVTRYGRRCPRCERSLKKDCDECEGTGWWPKVGPLADECRACDGRGWVEEDRLERESGR